VETGLVRRGREIGTETGEDFFLPRGREIVLDPGALDPALAFLRPPGGDQRLTEADLALAGHRRMGRKPAEPVLIRHGIGKKGLLRAAREERLARPGGVLLLEGDDLAKGCAGILRDEAVPEN